ncbi:hypothetical protein SAMN04488037_108105 [Shimia marina]|uniref:Uncharacterized protein n=1 Tax=Shimia marina TaxID=321267 RepID=A0A0P1EJF3_9RHOB|nr:hypothetical protein SHM7688_00090 [Shimia marina]SFE37429.1 hypothetical protein SAMN04488037_108105 [Shimia marina]
MIHSHTITAGGKAALSAHHFEYPTRGKIRQRGMAANTNATEASCVICIEISSHSIASWAADMRIGVTTN